MTTSCIAVCRLPLPTQRAICECTHEIDVTGKHISVVTMDGKFGESSFLFYSTTELNKLKLFS